MLIALHFNDPEHWAQRAEEDRVLAVANRCLIVGLQLCSNAGRARMANAPARAHDQAD
jgi:hypothetical protein